MQAWWQWHSPSALQHWAEGRQVTKSAVWQEGTAGNRDTGSREFFLLPSSWEASASGEKPLSSFRLSPPSSFFPPPRHGIRQAGRLVVWQAGRTKMW